MLTLHYDPRCPYSLRTRLVLAEKQLAFRRRMIAEPERHGVDEPGETAHEQASARGLALLDDTFTIRGSTVIAEYLEEAFPRPFLLPPEARSRAIIRMAMRDIEPSVSTRDIPGSAVRMAKHDETVATWEHRLGDNGLLFGMEMSLADVWLLSALEHAMADGWEPPLEHPKVSKWLARMRERTSVRTERLERARPV